ncbi:MAG: hypothetical protein ABJF01_17845 [bacterium]
MPGGELINVGSVVKPAMNRRRFIAGLSAVVGGGSMLSIIQACGGDVTRAVTALKLTGTLRGTVVDMDGHPQSVGRVYLLAKNGLNSGVFADVDAGGRYDFGPVAAGEYLVRFWGDNLGTVPEPFPNPVRVSVMADETTTVPFQITIGSRDGLYHDIFAGDFFFQGQPSGEPNGTVVAKLGTVICWYNVGEVVHSVTGGPWGDSGPIGLDGNFNWASDRVGTFPYRCRYHGTQMIATVQIIP